MPIIKEMKFKINSVIENLSDAGLADGEPEISESVCDGFFKISEDSYLITYSENTEGGRVISDIEIEGEKIRVKRVGGVCSDIVFSEGYTHKSEYEVPPYRFDMSVFTRKIRKNLTKDGGRVDIFYNMNIGGADKTVRMRIEVHPLGDK